MDLMQLRGRIQVIKNILAKGFRKLEKAQLNVQLRPLFGSKESSRLSELQIIVILLVFCNLRFAAMNF